MDIIKVVTAGSVDDGKSMKKGTKYKEIHPKREKTEIRLK
jgi:hypothetical protein